MDKLKNKKLWIMCGIPGLGKSTWLQNHKDKFEGTVNIISRDNIRFSMLKEDEPYFGRENDVWAKFVKDAITSLKYNENTILDATHLNPTSRKKILRALGNNLNNIEINAIYIKGPVELAIKRNKGREGRQYVPESAIYNMNSSLVAPSLDEEYINKIITIDMENGNIIIQERG